MGAGVGAGAGGARGKLRVGSGCQSEVQMFGAGSLRYGFREALVPGGGIGDALVIAVVDDVDLDGPVVSGGHVGVGEDLGGWAERRSMEPVDGE